MRTGLTHVGPFDSRRGLRVVGAAAACGAAATWCVLVFRPVAASPEWIALADWERAPRAAVVAWERAAALDPAAAPLRDLIRGRVAAARAEAALVLASGPDAPPAAFDRPIEGWTAALQAYADATVAGGPGFALARHDAEFAWWRLQSLHAAQEEARQRRQEEPPPPAPENRAGSDGGGDETRVAAVTEALPAEAIAGLLERLREKQEEKRTLRRETREPGAGGDW